MEIRRAAAGDMGAILALVDDVFTGEQGIPRALNPIPAEERPKWWCVVEEGEIAGCAAAYWENGECHMGRIAIAKPLRGMGAGTRLLKFALAEVFGRGADAVHMKARDATVHIVCKMGGKISGEPEMFYGGTVTPIVIERDAFYARNEIAH